MTRPCFRVRARPDCLREHRPAPPKALPRSLWLLASLLLTAFVLPATPARAAAQLWLPTPVGERWKIIQGYGCGTHNSWDTYSLDLVHADGSTRGAPVRAAADGAIFVWVAPSGTLILNHGSGFFTMYTHMERAVTTERGRAVTRGTVIGFVGDRGARGTPHLHFTAFTAEGFAARGRLSVPLTFAEGYELPDIGGCNQHGGSVLIASDQEGAARPGIHFNAPAEPERWYSGNIEITFKGAGLARGFSMAWDSEPGGDAPALPPTGSGTARLAEAGEGLHTLFVRGWGADGQSTTATYGPIGFDASAPPDPVPLPPNALTISAGKPATLRWPAVKDNASGVASYRVYFGTDPQGTSDWFTQVPQIEVPALAPGSYTLRVQAIDFAGNTGNWTTLGQVVSTAARAK